MTVSLEQINGVDQKSQFIGLSGTVYPMTLLPSVGQRVELVRPCLRACWRLPLQESCRRPLGRST